MLDLRYSYRPYSREFGDAFGGHNRASLDMHLEAVIERDWSYALGGYQSANLEAVIEWVWRCTWRP